MTATIPTAPTNLSALPTDQLAKQWEAAKADAAAADKVKKAADKVRGIIAGEVDERLIKGDVVTVDGNRRVQWDVQEYETEKAGEILKALTAFLTPDQMEILARLKKSPLNRTEVRKLAFKPYKD